MTKFVPGGPTRYRHQRQGLRKLIETRGVCALLMEPGLGKSATVIDYVSLLAIKHPRRVARVLVVCPLVAVDTWVSQTETFTSPQVDYWAEALGGSIKQKAEALAARGDHGYARVKPTRGHKVVHLQRSTAVTSSSPVKEGPRLTEDRPLLQIEVVNLDSFAQRRSVSSSKTLADLMYDAVMRYSPDLVVVDECHPSGTLVSTPYGERPIEELKIGDEVLSFDGSGIIVTKVTHTFDRETEEPLWRLGEMRATPEHPVWTENRGFVPVSEVKDGDTILRAVRRDVHTEEEGSAVLHEIVREEVHVEDSAATPSGAGRPNAGDALHARGEGEVVPAPERSGESFPGPRGQEEGGATQPGVGVPRPPSSRGQWHGVDRASTPAVTAPRMADGGRRGHRLASAFRGITELVLSRRGRTRAFDRGRGRWGVPQVALTSGVGQSEGRVSSSSGLDGVPLHQPAGDDGPRQRRVFNIETEHGVYFADGVLVHNSHRIKGVSSNSSRLLARIGKQVPRRVILSGTVMPHSPLDVFAQWRFLEPHAFGDVLPDGSRRPATFGGFKNRYARLGGYMGKEVVGFRRLDELRATMAENSISVRKKDALDLPTTTDVTIPVHLSPTEAKAYSQMKSDLATWLSDGSSITATSRLAQTLRLRQITAGHLPNDAGQVETIGNSKANTVRSLVHDTLAGESRVVVFTYFSHEIEQIRVALQEKGTEVMVVRGSTPVPERSRMRERFGSSDPQRMVMLAQVRTMNMAVNELVTASHAVFTTLPHTRDDHVQARDRLNRIGQQNAVTYWYLAAPGTVDEVVLESHRNRSDLEQAILHHVRGENS